MEEHPITVNATELEAIVRKATTEGIKEFFLVMGFDVSTPEGIIAAQKDFALLRDWRRARDTAYRQGILATTGVIVLGVLSALYMKYGPK